MAFLKEHVYDDEYFKESLRYEREKHNQDLKEDWREGFDELKYLEIVGMTFWKRKIYPFRCFFDVLIYNLFIAPKLNKARKQRKSKEEKELYDKKLKGLIDHYSGGYLFYYNVIPPEHRGYFRSKTNYLNVLDKYEEFSTEDMINAFGSKRNWRVFGRVCVDSAISKQIKLTLKNAKGAKQYMKTLLFYSPFRELAVLMKSKVEKTILPLEINNFYSTPHNWRIMINNSKEEINNKHEKGNG